MSIWVLLLLCLTPICLCRRVLSNPVLKPPAGPVMGNSYPTHQEYLGIFYAEPPTGNNRFRDPIKKSPWSSVFNATVFGDGCPQTCELPPNTCPATQSENCLSLNIYTPAIIDPNHPVPVLFFIPGGRFEQGSAATPLYSGAAFVNKTNTVLVVINYRLGVLASLTTEDITGNFAIKDQKVALQWVQDNIQTFGGDPTRVTVSGQSAGGTSVAVHMVSPDSYKFYHRVIMESDPAALYLKDKSDAQEMGKLLSKAVNCNDKDDPSSETECLQKTSINDILAAQKTVGNHIFITSPLQLFYPWTPHVDGEILTDQPWKLFGQGKFNTEVPMIAGNVNTEAILFIYQADKKPLSHTDYDLVLAASFHEKALKIADKYPLPSNETSDARNHLSVLGTDYIFWCPNRYMMNGFKKFSKNPLYFYLFDHAIDQSKFAWGNNYQICWDVENVCHGTELLFWFQPALYDGLWGTGELELSNQILSMWGSFTNGNPPSSQWPQYSPDTQPIWKFRIPQSSVEYKHRSDYCDFWDSIGYEEP